MSSSSWSSTSTAKPFPHALRRAVAATAVRAFLAACCASATALGAGCSSPERLTSRVTPCTIGEVQIVSSDFSRRGVTTAWCAECKGKLYLCATDVERNKAQCRPSIPEDACH